jgi:hypothetical protein
MIDIESRYFEATARMQKVMLKIDPLLDLNRVQSLLSNPVLFNKWVDEIEIRHPGRKLPRMAMTIQ